MATTTKGFTKQYTSLFCVVWFLSFVLGVYATPIAQQPANIAAGSNSKLPSYVPTTEACGSEPLIRPAQSISKQEREYIRTREKIARLALLDWFLNNNVEFNLAPVPVMALAISGGGYRSMLIGAGVVQSLDYRDTNDSTKGLYQALTYHSGLSGGSWLLGSIAGNGWATISSLSKQLWEKTLLKNSLYPLNTETAPEKALVQKDLADKAKAGFPITVTEAWGRFVAWQTLRGLNETEWETDTVYHMSKIRETREFKNYMAPYPIFTALGNENIDDKICDAADSATQYEMHPYEFGSWDAGIKAFTPMETLGTRVNAGKAQNGSCTKNFDDIGFLMGTSSSKFNEECGGSSISFIQSFLDPLVKPALNPASTTRQNLYGRYPNPFKGSEASPKVSKSDELYLVDGGQSNQNNPIWPFIQNERPVDVLFVNDNSADTDDNWPNGTEILHTYQQAKAAGLTRMPFIPDVATFVSKGLNKRATVFGCNKPEHATIVYLPNAQYAPGGIANSPTSKFDYAANETQAMIRNGNLIMTQNGDAEWTVCLACLVTHKAAQNFPAHCGKCLDRYCFKE